MATPAQAVRVRPAPIGLPVAWCGGADLDALADAPSERVFYDALGVVVLLISCASGFAACVAISYVLHVPVTRMWVVGVTWALTMVCIERLVLQLTATKLRWLVIGLVPRVALSLLVAVGMEPVILRINQSEINEHLSENVTNAIRAADTAAENHYVPLVESDYHQIAGIRAQQSGLTKRSEHYRFLSSCEASTPSCSTTGRAGCAAYCAHYAREANNLSSQLLVVGPQNRARIAYLQRDIKNQQTAMHTQETSRRKAIAESNGLSARLEALGAIEKKHPSVKGEVWFFRLLFLVVDLLPLSMKVIRMLSLESAPYDEACKAARRRDMVRIKRQNAAASEEEKRDKAQTRANIDVDQVSIRLDKERRIEEAHETNPSGHAAAQAFTVSAPIDAWDLDTFANEMTPHETRPVPVPSELRRGGLVGLAILLVMAGTMGLWSSLTGHSLAGTGIVVVCLGLVVILLAYTRGFRHAPAWALQAIFAGLLVGLVLPIIILGMNL